MASVAMTMPMTVAGSRSKEASALLFSPLQKAGMKKCCRAPSRLQVKASLREKAVVAATSAALTASMMVPQVAEAAELVPSLKNFLLSIAAGGIVLTAIGGAVIGVSYFDPVKRG